MEQKGIRVKDLEKYTGNLNRSDLSIPVDGDDFVTAKRITGQQLKVVIDGEKQSAIDEINTTVKNASDNINNTAENTTDNVNNTVTNAINQINQSANIQDVYNVTVKVPLQTGFYTEQTARAAVPTPIRKKGLIITYSTDVNVWKTEQFIGADINAWTSADNWKAIAGAGGSGVVIDGAKFNIIDGASDTEGNINYDGNHFASGFVPLKNCEKIDYALKGALGWPIILFFNASKELIPNTAIMPKQYYILQKDEITSDKFPTDAKYARVSGQKGIVGNYEAICNFYYNSEFAVNAISRMEQLRRDITYRDAFDIRFIGGIGLNGEVTFYEDTQRSPLISLENVEEIEYSLIGSVNYPAITFYREADFSTLIPNTGILYKSTNYIEFGIVNKTQFPAGAKYVCIMGLNKEKLTANKTYRPFAFLKAKVFSTDLANIRATIAENTVVTDLLKERINGFGINMETGVIYPFGPYYITPLYNKNDFDLLRLKLCAEGNNGVFLCYSDNNDNAYLFEETIFPLKGTMNFDVWVERDLPDNVKYFRFLTWKDGNYGIGEGSVKNIPEHLFDKPDNILQYNYASNYTAFENIAIGIKFKKKPNITSKVLTYDRGLPNFAKIEITNVPPLGTWPADKTKYNGHILYTEESGRVIDENITIAYQGSGTMQFPKKNFRITFSTLKKFGNFVPVKKINMKAYYMDISKVTEIILYKLYNILQQFSKTPLPWAEKTIIDIGARGVVDLFPCEMYVNGEFQGLYHFGLAKDGLNFNIDEKNPLQCVLEPPEKTRDIWNSVTNWAGISPETVPPGILTNFQIWLDFMRTSTDDEFRQNVGNYINIDEWIDLLIFYQATINWDGMDNNLNLATFDGGKTFHPFPYDMNECLGHAWTTNMILRPLHVDVFTGYVPYAPYNNIPFIDKFTRLFKNEMNARFKYLYDVGVYTFETFKLLVEDAATYILYDVFEKEKAKWPIPYNDPAINSPRFYTNGLLDFYKKRERYLKYYFNYKYTV